MAAAAGKKNITSLSLFMEAYGAEGPISVLEEVGSKARV